MSDFAKLAGECLAEVLEWDDADATTPVAQELTGWLTGSKPFQVAVTIGTPLNLLEAIIRHEVEAYGREQQHQKNFRRLLRKIEHLEHEPHRGSDVEAWIKKRRDEYRGSSGHGGNWNLTAWSALDDLLDEYREHADTGTPLGREVQGPHSEEN